MKKTLCCVEQEQEVERLTKALAEVTKERDEALRMLVESRQWSKENQDWAYRVISYLESKRR